MKVAFVLPDGEGEREVTWCSAIDDETEADIGICIAKCCQLGNLDGFRVISAMARTLGTQRTQAVGGG